MEFNYPTTKITSYIYMAMSILSTVGALFFDGKDIIIFLKQFKKLCKGYRIITNKRILE